MTDPFIADMSNRFKAINESATEKKVKLSLVIPVHNLEKYIEPLLVSLKYQAYDHDEIEPIFICDSCDDLTHQMVEVHLKGVFKHLVVIDREYHSSGLSRNDGIELATGEYIWLLDGDDWLIDNHAFKKVMEFFEAKPEDKFLRVHFRSNSYTNYNYLYTVWQWVWKAELAKAVKFTSQKYDDDVEWVQHMFHKFNILAFPDYPDPIYFYNYMREDSVMFKRKEEERTKADKI